MTETGSSPVHPAIFSLQEGEIPEPEYALNPLGKPQIDPVSRIRPSGRGDRLAGMDIEVLPRQ